jgi:hypothetical protein
VTELERQLAEVQVVAGRRVGEMESKVTEMERQREERERVWKRHLGVEVANAVSEERRKQEERKRKESYSAEHNRALQLKVYKQMEACDVHMSELSEVRVKCEVQARELLELRAKCAAHEVMISKHAEQVSFLSVTRAVHVGMLERQVDALVAMTIDSP